MTDAETFQASGEWFIELLERKDPHRTQTARQIIRNNMMKVNRYENLRLRERAERQRPVGETGWYRGDLGQHTSAAFAPSSAIADLFRRIYKDPIAYAELAVVTLCALGCVAGFTVVWGIV